MSTHARRPKRSARATIDFIVDIGRALFVERLGLNRESAATLALQCAQEFGRNLGGAPCYMRKQPAFLAARTSSVSSDEARRYTTREEALVVIARTTHSLLVAHLGLDAQRAREVAERYALAMGDAFSGEMFYFPKGAALAIQQRDEEIRALFNGRNHRELARAFSLSVARIYTITRQLSRQPKDGPSHACATP